MFLKRTLTATLPPILNFKSKKSSLLSLAHNRLSSTLGFNYIIPLARTRSCHSSSHPDELKLGCDRPRLQTRFFCMILGTFSPASDISTSFARASSHSHINSKTLSFSLITRSYAGFKICDCERCEPMFSVRYRESMWHRRLLAAAGLGDHTVLHRSSPFLSLVADTDVHQPWIFYAWRTPRHPYFPRRDGASVHSSVRVPFARRGTLPPILMCPTRSWRGTYSRIVHDRQRVLECVTCEHALTYACTYVAPLPSRPGVSLMLLRYIARLEYVFLSLMVYLRLLFIVHIFAQR